MQWIRAALALVVGIVCGVVPVLGAPGMLGFLAVSTAVCWVIYRRVLEVDDEDREVPEKSSPLWNGFMATLALFILVWTVLYNLVHPTLAVM